MEFITKSFIICSLFEQADFTAYAVLQVIRSEAPRLHGLRLASAANSTCEKCGLRNAKKEILIIPQYDLPDLPWLNTLHCPSELNGARRGGQDLLDNQDIRKI